MGRPRKPLDRRRRVAIHEAGHVVACLVLRRRLLSVSIGTASQHRGLTRCGQHPNLDPRRRAGRSRIRRNIRREIIIAWSGLVAEEIATGRRDLAGLEDDARMVDRLLRRLEPDPAVRIILGRKLLNEAIQLISDHWQAVAAMAKVLTEERTMSRRRCMELIHGR